MIYQFLKFPANLSLTCMGSNDTLGGSSVKQKDAESESILAMARRALDRNGDFRFGTAKLESEFFELDLLTPSERFTAVDIALNQITSKDRCGPYPPGNLSFTYERRVLYAFKWHSNEFGKVMYLKFCLSGTGGMELLVLYSFHEDRP